MVYYEHKLRQQRLLYVLIALAVIGVGIAAWIIVNLLYSESNQIKKLNSISQSQQRLITQQQLTIDQIKEGVADLKVSNDQQTVYIQCLLSALNVGDFPSTCQSPATTPRSSEAFDSSQPSSTPASTTPGSTTTPAPAKGPAYTILKALGL